MKISYDKIADALYIYLRSGKVAKTKKVTSRLLIDMDRKGNVLGIEMLDVSHQIPSFNLIKAKVEMKL